MFKQEFDVFGWCNFRGFLETNCPKGGDSSHGGHTRFLINHPDDGSNFSITVTGQDGEKYVIDKPAEIEFMFKGDAEGKALANILKYAGDGLLQGMELNANPS